MNMKTSKVLLASCFSFSANLKNISRCIFKYFNKKKQGRAKKSFNKHSIACIDLIKFLREDKRQWIYLNVLYNIK